MDYEEAANISNFTFDQEINPSQSLHYILHDIVFLLFSIAGICADALIIYTIFRFRRMRTVENIFLANWAIADLCSLVFTPSGYRVVSVLAWFPVSAELFCTIFHIAFILHYTAILFVIIVSIDWFIAAYFGKTSMKFRRLYKILIGFIWSVSLIICCYTTVNCLDDVYTPTPLFMFVISIFSILTVNLALHCIRAVRKCLKKPLEYSTVKLNLTTAYVGCWLLAIIITVVLGYCRMYSSPILIVAECLIFGSSLVNLYLLYHLDKDFQACLLQVLRRSSYNYEESICSFDSSPVKNQNGKDFVEISFGNLDDKLIDNMY